MIIAQKTKLVQSRWQLRDQNRKKHIQYFAHFISATECVKRLKSLQFCEVQFHIELSVNYYLCSEHSGIRQRQCHTYFFLSFFSLRDSLWFSFCLHPDSKQSRVGHLSNETKRAVAKYNYLLQYKIKLPKQFSV